MLNVRIHGPESAVDALRVGKDSDRRCNRGATVFWDGAEFTKPVRRPILFDGREHNLHCCSSALIIRMRVMMKMNSCQSLALLILRLPKGGRGEFRVIARDPGTQAEFSRICDYRSIDSRVPPNFTPFPFPHFLPRVLHTQRHKRRDAKQQQQKHGREKGRKMRGTCFVQVVSLWDIMRESRGLCWNRIFPPNGSINWT